MPFNPNLYLSPLLTTGNSDTPLPWSDLKFNPVGLYNLRKRLGTFPKEPGIFKRYQQGFMASDLAWFAAGASEDRTHHVQPNTFHPLFRISRENTPTGSVGNKLRAGVREHLRQLTFDLATTWDRAYGGSTLIIHVEGATAPGVPSLPEYLKADVYMPPHLIEEHPDCRRPIAAIVQAYIEEIGVRSVERYAAAGQDFGWSFAPGGPIISPRSENLPIFPAPAKQGSAHYVFRGRPYGALALLASSSDRSASVQHSSFTSDPTSTPGVLPSSLSSAPDQRDAFDLELKDAAEEIANLVSQLAQAALKEDTYLGEITILRNELADMYTTLRRQERRLEKLGMSTSQYDSGESTTARTDSPSPSKHALPPMTPKSSKGKQRITANSPTPVTPLKFPKLDVSQLGHPVYSSGSRWADSDIHDASDPSPSAHHFQTPCARSKPNREQEGGAVSSLGPTTVAFITHHNVMHLAPFLGLIVQNNSLTRWSTQLGALSLLDDLRDGILGALTVDLDAGAFEN